MSQLENLRKCTSTQDLALLLGYSAKSFTFVLYTIPQDKKYTTFPIPKKTGGERIIQCPEPKLKDLQRRLANILYACSDEIAAGKINPISKRQLSSPSHAFKRKHSIVTNAHLHKNKRYVLNLDLEQFFPSINFGRVRGFFIKSKEFALHEKIATLIAQIACYENQLPQGSPCSPIISELVTRILDMRLIQIAKKYNCTYSRYADDLTFSTNHKTFPPELASKLSDETSNWTVLGELEKVINKSGFSINHSKTRMQYKQSRQLVTGLTVNRGINTRKEYYKYARAMCHSLFRDGKYILPTTKQEGTIKQLEGILTHIHHIKDSNRTRIDKKNSRQEAQNNKTREKLDAFSETYSRFLFYKYFVAPDAPLIMCEGKTDLVHLKCAIRQLSKKKVYVLPYKVSFFRNSKRVTEVMRLYEGADALKNFIDNFENYTAFKNQPRNHPIIVVLDSDSKAHNAVQCIKGKYPQKGVNYDYTKTLVYYVTQNLYLVVLPQVQGKDSAIESFHKPETLAVKIDGKNFNLKNTSSAKSNECSKHILAEMVRRDQDKIDFAEFSPILQLINSVILDYQKKFIVKIGTQ